MLKWLLVGLGTWLLGVTTAGAAVYPLEISNIRPGLSPQNRLVRAYPGLEYNIRVAAIGGAFPYTYTLTGAPGGMTIDARTGTIVWANPRGDAMPTVTVTDSEGTAVSASWRIAVGTTGFRFVDARRGRVSAANGCTAECGAGTADSPWRSLADVQKAGAAGEIVYFRTGIYAVLETTPSRPGDPWEAAEFKGDRKPAIWLAYPGETPTLDFGNQPGRTGRLVRFSGDDVYVDGFEGINVRYIGFQYEVGRGGIGPTFRRLRMHRLGPGVDGGNCAFIMTMTGPLSRYMVVQDSEFFDVTGESVTIKIYSQEKMLIEDTVHHDAPVGIELKYNVPRFTVRGNRFFDIRGVALGGNMHEGREGTKTSGEILYNVSRADIALNLNQDGMAKQIDVYRNTFIGDVMVSNTDADDGPFLFYENVIANGGGKGGPRGSRLTFYQSVDGARVTARDNLAGDTKIVDADGNLTPAFAAQVGSRGHQLADRPRQARPAASVP